MMKGYRTYLFCIFLVLSPVLPDASASGLQKIGSLNFNRVSRKDTARINTLTRTAYRYLAKKGYLKTAEIYLDSALLYCKSRGIKPTAYLTLLRAEYALVTSDYENASDYSSLAISLAESEGDERTLAHAYILMGAYNFRTGFYIESIDNYRKGIDLAGRIGMKGIRPGAYARLSSVYGATEDLKEQQKAQENIIEAAINENDTSLMVTGYYLLGTLYADRIRNFSKSDSLLRKCFNIARIRNDSVNMTLSLVNRGWNFYLEKMYDSSIIYYKRALDYTIPARLYGTSANAYGNLGTIYRDLNDIRNSLDYYRKSIELAIKLKDFYNLQWVYKDMTDMYLKSKDTSRAYVYHILYKQYYDSMMIDRNRQGLSDARLRYETDSHNKEVELLSLKIKNQRLMIYGFSALGVSAMALVLLLFRGSKLKAKRRISEMNRKISELTQANLRQQMNPHFIFNTLNSIQYYMYQHDKLATNNYLTKFTNLMRKVLENSQHTSISLSDELDALNLYLELESIRFKNKFDYEITVDEEIDTLLFKIPTMLIQPYVENSICHGLMPGEGKGMLKIDIKLEKDFISCTIEDNGIGREAAQKRKSAQGLNHNSLGTQIVSSRLDLVNALYGTSLKTIYTDLKNSDGEPGGTRVEIHIPIIT